MMLRPPILFCLLLIADFLAAQTPSSAKAATDKTKILIGEPLLLMVEADLPAGKSGSLLLDSIEHFEFLSPPVIDSSSSSSGIRVKGNYRITSFDSGRWVIPPMELAQGIKTNAVEVDVVFSEFNPEQDYHDIKDIEDVKKPKKKIPGWWIALTGFILLLSGLAVYFLRKKKKLVPSPPIRGSADPYKEAVGQLSALRAKAITGKPFHTELSGIFRLYVFRQKGILSLQKTTEDLILQLKSRQIPADTFEEMAQALRLGDYVKFAKYTATTEDDAFCFKAIAMAIEAIQQQSNVTA
jgi:LPXTG-motif cell wall-anchored protein